jgi:hypothetical protein
MHHRSNFQAQNRVLPDELLGPPAKPPHEPLIIKIPPGGTPTPEPWPPRPPREPDIDEDDQQPWIPPRRRPPVPNDRPRLARAGECHRVTGNGSAVEARVEPRVMDHGYR